MKKPQEYHRLRAYLMLFVVSLASVVQAEDVTVTTYYPSPRGNYQTLSTTSTTNLATNPADSVVVGGAAPVATTKLDVRGGLRLRDGTQLADRILQTNALGEASWVDPNTITGIVTGSGSQNRVPLWVNLAGTQLGNSEIFQDGTNIRIGPGVPGGFKLDVVGTQRITGTLTLGLPALVCNGTDKLVTSALGVVGCAPEADGSTTNEFNDIRGGAGLLPDIASPPSVTLSVNTGPGITITGDQVTLTNPSLTCPPAATTRAIHDFDLRNGVVNCVDAGGGAGGGFTGTLSTSDPDVTLSPNPWDPDTGVNATISVSAAASPLPSGSSGDTLRNTAAGVNWAASSLLYNSGSRIGIGTSSPSQLLDVNGNINASGNMNIGALSTYQRGGIPGVSATCTSGNTPNGITIAGGIVTSAGACTTIGGGGSLPAGTANGQTLRYDGLAVVPAWVADSNLFNNGTNVGIGTATPDPLAKLHIGGTNSRMYLGTAGWFVINRGAGAAQDLYFGENADTGRYLFRGLGNVGIGTETPAAKLDINGQIRITGGAPAAGKVLTSDATGLATWTIPAGGVSDVLAGVGLTRTVAGSTITLDVGTPVSSGISVAADSIALANPSQSCSPPNVIQSFNLGTNTVTCVPPGGGVGAPVGAEYIVSAADPTLTAEDVLMAGAGLTGTNGIGTFTLDVVSPAGSGITVAANSIALTDPIKDCPAGQVIQSFDLGGTGVPICIPTAGGLTGSGTLNFVSKWTGASSLGNSSIFDNGNVGIGTTAPAGKLHVTGTGDVQFNTSGGVWVGSALPGYAFAVTKCPGGVCQPVAIYGDLTQGVGLASRANFSGQLQILGGSPGAGKVLTSDATGLASWQTAGGGGGVTGAGSLNYVTKWTNNANPGALSTTSSIFDNGNVGIGTTSPSQKLDVNGQIAVGGVGVITQGGNDVYANIRVLRNTSPTLTDGMYIGYGGSGGPLRFFSNSGVSERMTLTTTGDVGIGTTSPGARLEVNGQIKITGGSPGAGKVLTSDAAGLATWAAGGGGGVNAGTTNYVTKYNAAGTNLVNSSIFDNGNVGIGTTSPSGRLHIGGTDQRMYLGTGGWFVFNRGVGSSDIYFGEDSDSGTWRFRGGGGVTVQGEQVCRANGVGCPAPTWTTAVSNGGLMYVGSFSGSATCPVGYTATGGGIRQVNSGAFGSDIRLASYPDFSDRRMWRCEMGGANTAGVGWLCHATCLRFPN